MKILFLTNNEVAVPLFRWLAEVGEEVTLVEEKLTADSPLLEGAGLLVSYNYLHLLRPKLIERVNRRILNLHTSLLPWNRGISPNLWSVLDDTPKGVTIHVVDEGLDTGPILLQAEVEIDEERETLRSSYELLHRRIQELFRTNWASLRSFTPDEARPQVGRGSYHSRKDFERIRSLLEPEGFDVGLAELKRRYRRAAGA